LILDEADVDAFLSRYKLLVLPGAACLSEDQAQAVDRFVEKGGALLATGQTALYTELGLAREGYGLQSLGAARVKTIQPRMRSAYWRVHETSRLCALEDIELILLDGPCLFVEPRPGTETSLTLVPPCTYGPPEKVAIDRVESDVPGVLWYSYGAGQSAYLPWEIETLYHRHSSSAHNNAYLSVVLELLPQRQVISNANPQVEIALYKQGEGYAINLVNVSGHHGTAFFAPVPMYDLEIKVRLPTGVTQARSLQLDRNLTLWQEDDYTCLNLDRLDLWDGIRLT
jgi:hypothetical protein